MKAMVGYLREAVVALKIRLGMFMVGISPVCRDKCCKQNKSALSPSSLSALARKDTGDMDFSPPQPGRLDRASDDPSSLSSSRMSNNHSGMLMASSRVSRELRLRATSQGKC